MTRQTARTTNSNAVIDPALGSLGLLLIVLVGWAVERQQSKARVDVILGRLMIQCVSAIGWIVDRGPWPTSQRRDRTGAFRDRDREHAERIHIHLHRNTPS